MDSYPISNYITCPAGLQLQPGVTFSGPPTASMIQGYAQTFCMNPATLASVNSAGTKAAAQGSACLEMLGLELGGIGIGIVLLLMGKWEMGVAVAVAGVVASSAISNANPGISCGTGD